MLENNLLMDVEIGKEIYNNLNIESIKSLTNKIIILHLSNISIQVIMILLNKEYREVYNILYQNNIKIIKKKYNKKVELNNLLNDYNLTDTYADRLIK